MRRRNSRRILTVLLLGAALLVTPGPASVRFGPVTAIATLEAPPEPPPPEKPGYNAEYFFATTLTVAYSTLPTAVKPPLFLLTLPLDVALLPVAAIAGFF